jgi:hypothetical protein
MPLSSSNPRVPKYRRHKPSGQAVVTLSGKDFYLGKWNTKASGLSLEACTSSTNLQSIAVGKTSKMKALTRRVIARPLPIRPACTSHLADVALRHSGVLLLPAGFVFSRTSVRLRRCGPNKAPSERSGIFPTGIILPLVLGRPGQR